VLLLYDGAPRFSPVENSPYERALNTPFVVVRNQGATTCYLSSGKLWYEAQDPLGPWSHTTSPPADLVKMLPPPDSAEPAPKVPPETVGATEPTELIATDGKPRWKSLTGGKILYVENTETPGCASSKPAICTYCCPGAGITQSPRPAPGPLCTRMSCRQASRRFRQHLTSADCVRR
jgi:hypothetical protein